MRHSGSALLKRNMNPVFLTHHKCASNWLATYLHEFCTLNQLSFGCTGLSRTVPLGEIVLLANASYRFVQENGLAGYHVIRNPLSVLTSAYFSHLHSHPVEGWPELAAQRALLLSVDRITGLYLTMAFIERPDFSDGSVGPFYGLRTWDYDNPDFVTLRMEDMVRHPAVALREALASVGIENPILPRDQDFSFARFSNGRTNGEIDAASHYRSGSDDDWREHLPSPVVDYVKSRFRTLMDRFYNDVEPV